MLNRQAKIANNANPELSIVLPTYNERDNLAILIPEIESGFKDCFIEVIIVDDNSQDGTGELVDDLQKRFGNVRSITRLCLSGIGSALRDGYNAAKGIYILSSDADLSFTVPDMVRLHEKIKEGFDMVVGYRHGGGGQYERSTPAVRIKYLVSKFGNLVVRVVSGIKIRDFSANFRIIKREKWLSLKTAENTNALLFEMILKATRNGLSISEIPVSFFERRYGQSKLVLWKEVPKFLLKLLKYTFLDR